MKKQIISVLFALTTTVLFAQSQLWELPIDSVTAYAGYVGYAGLGYGDQFGKNPTFSNLRIGVTPKWKGFNGFATYDPKSDLVIWQARWSQEIDRGLIVRYGKIPTLATLIRPLPASVDGQFQFAAEVLPPSGALGVSLENKYLSGGVYLQSKRLEYQVGFSFGKFKSAAWLQDRQNCGVTAQFNGDRLYTMTTIIPSQTAVAIGWQFDPDKKTRVVINASFENKSGLAKDFLIGLLYPVNVSLFKDFRLGAGWDVVNQNIGVFWLCSLEKTSYRRAAYPMSTNQ